MENQGKEKKQLEHSAKMAFLAVIGMLVIIILAIINNAVQ
jgi:hypothetical protein